MIRKIFKKIYIYFFINSFFIRINNNDNFSYNFLNINFDNYESLKKLFLSNKYYKGRFLENKDYDYHCFDWLLPAKKIGGAKNVNNSKKLIFNWSKNNYSKSTFVWNTKITTKRLTNLIYYYDFYAISSDEKEKKFFYKLIYEHYLLLEINRKFDKIDEIPIEVVKILILMRIIFKKNLDKILSDLRTQLFKFVDINGYHRSYNPSYQAEFINQLHEIKNILLYFDLNISQEIYNQLDSMTSAFNNLFHKDSSIALFNGSNNANDNQYKQIEKLISDIKPKKLDKIENGICIYNDKYKKIFFDIVTPSNKQINKNLHSGTLSFEMSCLDEKIITNCGSVEKRYGKKPEYLRYSAAHSTLVVDNTNISELSKNSYKRIPKKLLFNHEENDEEVIWIASHDGYKENFNRIVKRKLRIFKRKNYIIGEDTLILLKFNSKKTQYNIRFHLTPICSCLLSNNKKTVFIKTQKNQSWVFNAKSAINLEDSIYIKDGKTVEKTKQIVISNYVDTSKKVEQWSLEKI